MVEILIHLFLLFVEGRRKRAKGPLLLNGPGAAQRPDSSAKSIPVKTVIGWTCTRCKQMNGGSDAYCRRCAAMRR